jgi:hypothetical protein
MSDLQDASTINWRCHSCFRLFDNSVQATHTARKGAICPDCFNTEPLFSKAYVEKALATYKAELAEKVRGLEVTGDCYCADLIGGGCWLCQRRELITEVLALIEGEK